jgi:23S rRNA (cytidine1920-2'-O)/16S rRNA (cytidine1409-2'-O)-methyltransferase
VLDGRVTVGGAPADKPDRQVATDEALHVAGPPRRYVGRGGDKLEAALDAFALDPAGQRWLDAGSSTGGFTDCLLQRGASAVLAVDVGRGQLHERLRQDPRVDVRERTDVRDLTPEGVAPPLDGIVADLAFIGLGRVLPGLVPLAAPGAPVVVLVKPQFEAGRAEADRGRGVIRDPGVWRDVLERIIDAAAEQGATIMGGMVSPLRGADGNVEFFLHLGAPDPRDAPGRAPVGLAARLVAEATSA